MFAGRTINKKPGAHLPDAKHPVASGVGKTTKATLENRFSSGLNFISAAETYISAREMYIPTAKMYISRCEMKFFLSVNRFLSAGRNPFATGLLSFHDCFTTTDFIICTHNTSDIWAAYNFSAGKDRGWAGEEAYTKFGTSCLFYGK